MATGKWSKDQAEAGERANYRCEYCDLDLLSSIDNYKLWTLDHIVPKEVGGDESLDNLAIACRMCNVYFKWRWDPRKGAPAGADRAGLVAAVRLHVEAQRIRMAGDLELVRQIVEYKPNPECPIR
ncbi:HNH endonuclease [Paludibaculum fermentans]|uniref:HNH endonuclease n=2 Tax=Paludibaculum fermentans TaxID=1473598 RepID=A0A7S7NYD1_PALFE|nr:HNH endonuclease [Paludibaculum fermentans]